MSTILVEARRDEANGPALDLIASVCRALGHDVFRWRGPLSGRVPYWRRLFACDLAILWNGAHPRYRGVIQTLARRGTKILYVELGWHPQRGTIQIDPQGVNARASWSSRPLASIGQKPLPVRERGDLLVVLQLERDTQITQLSPYFREMRSFVEFLARNSALPVRVRAHPREVVGTLRVPFADDGTRSVPTTWICDASPSLAAALASAKAVATINSSCGVEALAAGLPVLCYGQAIYRHEHAVYCLDDNPQLTRAATAELAAGACRCYREPIAELLRRIADHQWSLDDIPARLPGLLETLLADATPQGGRWALAPLVRFARDLPPRLLAPLARPAPLAP